MTTKRAVTRRKVRGPKMGWPDTINALFGDRGGQRGGESNGANLALAARVYRYPTDFIASAWAIVAVFSTIIGAK
jgi:hypothetical protein